MSKYRREAAKKSLNDPSQEAEIASGWTCAVGLEEKSRIFSLLLGTE